MLWFLALAGIAAAAVAAYYQLRRHDPAGADQVIEVLRELSAVVVIVAQAVISALEALARPQRMYAAVGDPRSFPAWGEWE
jgi:formate-dependent nitrite reductase membrane component NrfD